MSRKARTIGNAWEGFAERHVTAAGLQILARQYHCRLGEIDLVALDAHTLVFIEVRYRRSTRFGGAAASVTRHKQQRIVSAARHFLMHHPQYCEYPMRMDVIALERVEHSRAPPARVRWIRAAFDAQ